MARQGPPPSSQQPMSFKTVPGRNRTQKWQQARTYNYDGDDWGSFDSYDEYAGRDDPPTAPQPPFAQQRPQRLNSFDVGDERRHYSAGAVPPPGGFFGDDRRGSSATNSSGRPSVDSEGLRIRPRDFTNPEQVPPPLNTRFSPAPPGRVETVPARKSSMSTDASTLEPSGSQSATMLSKTDKPLPFIRPSDIYKRMAEEKERETQSMESSRTSVDSIQHEVASSSPAGAPGGATDSPATSSLGRRSSLEPVVEHTDPEVLPTASQQAPHPSAAERQSRQIDHLALHQEPEYKPWSSPPQKSPPLEAESGVEETRPSLPPVGRISGFGSSFIDETLAETPQPQEDEQTPTIPQGAQSTAERVFKAPVLPSQNTQRSVNDSLQANPTATRASDAPALSPDVNKNDQPATSDLQHQPSYGFRSVVNRAFDRPHDSSVPATPISCDNSLLSGDSGGVSRSNTNSTSSISPIMSHVPSAAISQQREQERDRQVPTIDEEPAQAPPQGTQQIPRKPSPGHSRNPSAETAGFQPGYRRSLDPPSTDNSPARTPVVEDNPNRRLSVPMTAETVVGEAEAPDLPEHAVEMHPTLEPAETPADEVIPGISGDTFPLPTQTRGRSGTDYSRREADIANTVNASPDQPGSFSSQAAEVERSRQEFLHIHSGTPTSPLAPGIQSASTPTNGGRDSPAKGRVREIAETYNAIEDEAKRKSQSSVSAQSSWSNFRGSDENLPGMLRRQMTGGSQLSSVSNGMTDHEERGVQNETSVDPSERLAAVGTNLARPEPASQQSFAPHLPGEWVSAAPTPAGEEPPTEGSPTEELEQERNEPEDFSISLLTPRASRYHQASADVDLTPTTRRVPLQEGNSNFSSPYSDTSAFSQVKNAGTALGTALMASAGLTSQTRDFGSTEPPAPVEQPDMQPRAPTGDLNLSSRFHPPLERTESEVTDAPSSVATDMPPMPPAKDTPGAPQADVDEGPHGNRASGYFSPAVQPLRAGHSKENSAEVGEILRPPVLPLLSTDTVAYDMDSDQLSKEIVRSLDSPKREEIERESIMGNVERTQDALDAPDNERGTKHGEVPFAATEAHASGKKALPRMLDQRFSWENRESANGGLGSLSTAPPAMLEVQEPESPEVKPEMPYERAHTRALHVMNAGDENMSPMEERKPSSVAVAEESLTKTLPIGVLRSRDVSPMSGENLALPNMGQRTAGESPDMQYLAPSSISDERTIESPDPSPIVPSYYFTSQEEDAAAPSTAPAPPAKDVTPPMTPTAQKRQSGRIPPFREILAIKSSPERIQAYNDTRQIFADMDTGLSSWLSGMLAERPEYANVGTSTEFGSPRLRASDMSTFKHRHSPSIVKYTKQFTGGDRKASLTGATVGGEGEASVPPKTPSKDPAGDEPRFDMDKMQQRGKVLMKSAGKLGGKAQEGAKGLFQRGKSRFGGKKDSGDGKAPTPPPPSSTTSTPPVPSLSPATRTAMLPVAAPSRQSSKSPLSLQVSEAPSYYSSSPVPRPRSQTPSSTTSRPLSQVFERLREKNRPRSASRSDSRTHSLVVTKPDLMMDREDERSLPTVDSGAESADLPSGPKRRETGDEPDATVPQQDAEDHDRTPTRLGVLPSPAVEHFLEQSPTRAVPSVEDVLGGGDGTRTDADAQGDETQRACQPWTVDVGPSDVEGPKHEREISALASLPSQLRRSEPTSPMSLRSPQCPAIWRHQDDEDEELYQSSPIAIKASSPGTEMPPGPDNKDDLYSSTITPSTVQALVAASLARSGPSFGGTEGNRVETTPSARTGATASAEGEDVPLPQPEITDLGANAAAGTTSEFSRRTTADGWDKQSTVSAEDAFVDAVNAVDANDSMDSKDNPQTDSRRSSVSSLGGPDTGVAKRASYVRTKSNQQVLLPRDQEQQDKPVMSAQAVPAGPIYFEPRGGQTGSTSATSTQDPHVHQDTILSPPAQRSMSGQALPLDQKKFMARSYHWRDSQRGRPMSYMPLGRDSSGRVQQETLDTVAEPTDVPVDLSGISGPPVGVPPAQKHPLHRDSATVITEYEHLRSPRTGREASTPADSRQASDDPGDRRSRRFSGFFRESKAPSVTQPEMPAVPAANATGTDLGLEDIRVLDGGSTLRVPTQTPDDRQDQRRSSSWVAFKPAPGVSRTDLTGEGSIAKPLESRTNLPTDPAVVAANKARENTSRDQALQKPQRAASTATTQEPKKKQHFSGIGSLFGRSGSKGHSTTKSNKLTKMQPPSRETFTRERQPPLGPSGSVRGDDGYEAMQRQIPAPPTAIPAYQTQLRIMDSTAIGAEQGMPPPPPPEGWYGPRPEQPPITGQAPIWPSQPQPPPPPSQIRTLHSKSYQRGLQYEQVPEAFRPTETAFGRQAMPVGPPLQHQPPYVYEQPGAQREPTLPTEQPRWSQGMTGPPPPRQGSYDSGGYQLSPQVSGHEGFRSTGGRRGSSLPSISSVHSRTVSEGYTQAPRDQRLGPLNEEFAHSPARNYAEQQKPWAITFPSGVEGSQRSSRASSWAVQGGSRSGAGDDPATSQPTRIMSPPSMMMQRSPPHGMPMSPQSLGSMPAQPYRNQPPLPPPRLPPDVARNSQHQRHQQRIYEQHQGAYPSPPYSTQGPSPPQRQALHGSPQNIPPSYAPPPQNYPPSPSRPGQRPDFYEDNLGQMPNAQKYPPKPTRRFSGNSGGERFDPGTKVEPSTYQRTSSGYSGRRDDMAVGEDELVMRGASYPGQEWSPAGTYSDY